MYDAAQGEPIARTGVRPKWSGSSRCGNPGRVASSGRCGLPCRPDEGRRKPIETLGRRDQTPRGVIQKRARGDRAKSRTRFSRANPNRANPKGAASGSRANPAVGRQELSKGLKPRSRGLPGRPAATATRRTAGKTACGFIRAVTRRIPSERRKLRRANPTSAAGAKQNRQGIAGRKPSRG